MITHDNVGEVTVTNIAGIQDMGLKVTGKSFALLIDKLYTRKEDAVVRELGANARDAMNDLAMATGTPIQPFSIQLPNDICHELIIRDNGTGLSVENVHKYLGNLFESSKENENNSIGAYGLGSKSPFAVTDTYIIQSRFEGQLHSFSFFRAKSGIPQLVHIGSEPTDEPNGITFKVPASPSRYNTYAKAVAAQLFFFEPRPTVGGNTEIWDDYGKIIKEHGNWKMIESRGLKDYYGPVLANMGGVSYPLEYNRLKEIDVSDDFIIEVSKTQPDPQAFLDSLPRRASDAARGMETLIRSAQTNAVYALFFNIGDLEVPPSREQLEYDAQTCYSIILGIEELFAQMTQAFLDDIKANCHADNPQGIREHLMKLCKIINWDTESGSYQAPESFTKPIRALTWQIKLGHNLPNVIGPDGKIVDGMAEISARSPSKMLDDLNIIFPHRLVNRVAEQIQRFGCDAAGVVADQKAYDHTMAQMKDSKFVETERKINTHAEKNGGLRFELYVRFQKPYTEWVPCIEMTPEISPINNRVTADVAEFQGIRKRPLTPPPEYDRWGNRNRNAPHDQIIIIVDDEDKAKELTKYGTWALRRSIGKDRGWTEQQALNTNPNECRKHIHFLRGYTPADIEFYKLWCQQQKLKPEIWSLKELVIPKPERKIGDSSLTLRGVKRVLVRHQHYDRPFNNIAYGTAQDYVFGAIKGDSKGEITVKPDWLVFGDGKTESVYLDPALTQKVSLREVVSFVQMINRLQGFTREAGDKYIYRLTPINIKQLDKFKEQGFRVLADAIKAVGMNIVGSSQFKRRYKASLLTHALWESDTYGRHEVKHPDGTITHRAMSELRQFTDKAKLEVPKMKKHLARLDRTYSDKGIRPYGKDFMHMEAFAYSYANIYKRALSEVEAMRIVIDAMFVRGAAVYEIYRHLFCTVSQDKDGNPTYKAQVPYASKVVKHAEKNFRTVRARFLKDKYKEVLFSGFFSRDSRAFSDALAIAKVALGA